MNELGELGHSLDEVALHKLTHPFGRFLTHLRLKLHFEHTIRETLDIGLRELLKRIIDADVHTTPVVARALLAVPVVFTHQRELRVKRDTHTGITR